MDLSEHPTVVRFRKWVEDECGGSATAAAKLIPCTDVTVGYLRSGARLAGLGLALKIERATRGAIRPEDWQAAADAREKARAEQQAAEPAPTGTEG